MLIYISSVIILALISTHVFQMDHLAVTCPQRRELGGPGGRQRQVSAVDAEKAKAAKKQEKAADPTSNAKVK